MYKEFKKYIAFNITSNNKNNQKGITSLLLLILFSVIILFLLALFSRISFDYSSTSKEHTNYSEDLKQHNLLEAVKQDYKYDLFNDVSYEDVSLRYKDNKESNMFPFKIAFLNYGYTVDRSYLKTNGNYIDYDRFSNLLACHSSSFEKPMKEDYAPSTYKDLVLPTAMYGNIESLPFKNYEVSRELLDESINQNGVYDLDLYLELYGQDVRTYSIGENFYIAKAKDFEWDLLGYNPKKNKGVDAYGKEIITSENPTISDLESLKLNTTGKVYLEIDFEDSISSVDVIIGNEHVTKKVTFRKNKCNPYYELTDIPKGSTFIKLTNNDDLGDTSFKLVTARELEFSVNQINRLGGLNDKVELKKRLRIELTNTYYKVFYTDPVVN